MRDRGDDARRGPAIAAHLRAMRPPPHHPPPPLPSSGDEDGAACGGAGEGDARGVRVAAARGLAGADAVRVGDVRDRVHPHAVGDRARHGILLRRRRLEPLRIGEGDPLP